MIASHRVLRYAAPFLHVGALVASFVLGATHWFYAVALALQLGADRRRDARAHRAAAPAARRRYYVLTTASVAAGLWDWLRHGTPAGWEPAEGTR